MKYLFLLIAICAISCKKEDLTAPQIFTVVSLAVTPEMVAGMVQKNTSIQSYEFYAKNKLYGLYSDEVMKSYRDQRKQVILITGNSLAALASTNLLNGKFFFNRGMGGSFAANWTEYRDDLGARYADIVIMYNGENEFVSGYRRKLLYNDYIAAINYWHSINASATFIVCLMQVCPSLWNFDQKGNWDIDDHNRKIRAYASARPWIKICDLNVAMKKWANGTVTGYPECFVTDTRPADGTPIQVHMNDAGYTRWKNALMPILN